METSIINCQNRFIPARKLTYTLHEDLTVDIILVVKILLCFLRRKPYKFTILYKSNPFY